uniref:Uncharacterized protein n=1 Tax=Tetranychus urticae TaxID=32264 RepID=T1KSV8_TETUR
MKNFDLVDSVDTSINWRSVESSSTDSAAQSTDFGVYTRETTEGNNNNWRCKIKMKKRIKNGAFGCYLFSFTLVSCWQVNADEGKQRELSCRLIVSL